MHAPGDYRDIDARSAAIIMSISPERRMVMSVAGNFIGTMAIIKDMLRISRWMPLQVAWGDHSPLNYLRISKAQPSGFATPGDELGSTVPGLC